MDPTHFLSSRLFQTRNPGPAEADAFYDLHGRDLFATLSRWRARIDDLRRRLTGRRRRPAGFASPLPRG